ncbi:YwqJ-related putative deaminase [Cryptosporangium sp. NPDC048952]|uniref:YwqJ-related putative deaminase n=1 Tax=Cryptosporangium sp. NPDC048952 TaxID=3363961 RepID=UPI003724196B
MAALNRTDAEELARRWVAEAAPGAEAVLHEFELGWVISARYPLTADDPLGIPSMVLNRESGELVVGGTLPPQNIAEWYVRGFEPQTTERPRTRFYPATMSRLTIADRSWIARSLRSDADRPLHPVVSTFFDAMPADYRERGCERSSEAVVFSDLFYAEENARIEAGRPRLVLDDAKELVRGARIETFRIREDGDPSGGTAVRSGLPALLFLDYLGLSPDAARA